MNRQYRGSLHSLSNERTNGTRELHPWIQKHYQEKCQRTVTLFKVAGDRLTKEQQTVTVEATCRKSAEIDPDGRDVKKSAILENPEAHVYYREYSTSYRNAQAHKRQRSLKGEHKASKAQRLRLDQNRNVDRARYRYMQLTKFEIVEQAYTEVHQQLTQLQFELLEIQQHQKQ